MEFIAQPIADCYVIALEPFTDDRGFFARAFSADDFGEAGLVSHISQINVSRSTTPGTVRGIHWQEAPHEEAKLVRCTQGRLFDVCVDVRPDSDSKGQWVGVELTSENHLALYIPPGCGHGHQTLEPDTELVYTTSVPYAPKAERGARWNDPAFSIDWPQRTGVTLSAKDMSWPEFVF